MGLFWGILKPKPKCEHYWQFVVEQIVIDLIGNDVEDFPGVVIYCPKCKSEDHVYTHQWNKINKIQQIKREYEAKQQAD